jgi:hypothetical protein
MSADLACPVWEEVKSKGISNAREKRIRYSNFMKMHLFEM